MVNITATASLLQAAMIGLEFQRDQTVKAIAEIRAELGRDGSPSPAGATEAPMKRTMSASARRRIALAQKRRWAAVHAAKSETVKPPRKKRKISAAGRARIIAATKKRWAAFRKAKAKAA